MDKYRVIRQDDLRYKVIVSSLSFPIYRPLTSLDSSPYPRLIWV